MVVFTTAIIISVSSGVTGLIAGAVTYPYVRNELNHRMEEYRMRKKINKLLEEIEDNDPDSIINMICDTTCMMEEQNRFVVL